MKMPSRISDLLNKINRLASENSLPQISTLEYDLLMQHLRDLYEELSELKEAHKEQPVIERTVESIQPAPIVLPEKKEEIINVKQKEEQVVLKTPVEAKASSRFSINEVVQSGETLNSKLKANSREVHHKLSTKPMKELIDLNKRYVVVSELFKGDADACAKAIQQIDAAENYSAAESYIHSTLIPAYKWNESSETVKLFSSLVKQKFGAE